MLKALFSPARIAVMADTMADGSVGQRLVRHLLRGGFGGEVVPVCDSGGSVEGLPCHGRAKEAEGPVDLALIHGAPRETRRAAKEAARAGARAVVVCSGGFRKAGAAGAALLAELTETCKERDLGLLGPSSLGVMSVAHRMNASLAETLPQAGGISILSQNGAVSVALLNWARRRRLGLAKLVCVGEQAGLDEVALLKALAWDPETRVVVTYLESISAGDAFLKAAEEAAQHKPVVVLKAGVTPAGVRAAAALTGARSDASIEYGAAFRRAGLVHAPTAQALLDYAAAFDRAPLPAGDRVAVISTGGPGVLAADALDRAGLQVAGGPGEGNAPVEVDGDAPPERYVQAVAEARANKGVDAVVLALAPHAMAQPRESLRALCGPGNLNGDGEKPVLASWLGGGDLLEELSDEERSELPDYVTPERAVAALAAMREYAAWRRRPPRRVTRFPVNRRRVERIIKHHQRAGQLQLSEVRSKEVLKAYGFNVPEGELATSGEEAVAIAERIGLPVVLKIDSPDLPHKTSVGGLRLNLGNPDAVHDAYDLMMMRLSQRHPEARIRGVWVERMGFSGREVVLGMQRDPQFGPLLLFGLGGAVVETMQDVSFHLAPVTAGEALQMLEATRSVRRLDGAPGPTLLDLKVIAQGLQRVSQLATDFPSIRELDLSPFVVGGSGREPYVADARIVLAAEGDHD